MVMHLLNRLSCDQEINLGGIFGGMPKVKIIITTFNQHFKDQTWRRVGHHYFLNVSINAKRGLILAVALSALAIIAKARGF